MSHFSNSLIYCVRTRRCAPRVGYIISAVQINRFQDPNKYRSDTIALMKRLDRLSTPSRRLISFERRSEILPINSDNNSLSGDGVPNCDGPCIQTFDFSRTSDLSYLRFTLSFLRFGPTRVEMLYIVVTTRS